jgi:uncharacterized phage infection (PIP) family protein YhgE
MKYKSTDRWILYDLIKTGKITKEEGEGIKNFYQAYVSGFNSLLSQLKELKDKLSKLERKNLALKARLRAEEERNLYLLRRLSER